MGVPRKPVSKVGRIQRQRRARQDADPTWHEQEKRKRREYHAIPEVQQREAWRKKMKTKQQKEFLYKRMGSKCQSCGEDYNPHKPRTNLYLAHKIYIRSTKNQYEVFRQAKAAYDMGGIKELFKQFALLCYSCHTIFDIARGQPKKYQKALEYMKNIKVLEF